MSGLIGVHNLIVNVNAITLVYPFADGFEIKFADSTTLGISKNTFAELKTCIEARNGHKNEIDRLIKENEHLRGMIAALPGMGEDYKTARLEFEHIAEKK